MTPRVVWDKRKFHFVGHECTGGIVGECLGIGGECDESVDNIGTVGCRYLRILVYYNVVDIEFVVGPFGTIHQRATLESHSPTVGCHVFVGYHCTRFHIEVNVNYIALFPLTVNGYITFFDV